MLFRSNSIVEDPYTYKVTCKTTNRNYYGWTTQKYRWTLHLANSKNKHYSMYNTPFYQDIRKYGEKDFTFTKLTTHATKLEAKQEEAYLINNDPNKYNVLLNGTVYVDLGPYIVTPEITKMLKELQNGKNK